MIYEIKTRSQRKNFVTLLVGLLKMYGDKQLSGNFKMAHFQVRSSGVVVPEPSDAFTRHKGLSSASMLGHGPIFGITAECLPCHTWGMYAREVFGSESRIIGGDWCFLFSEEWPDNIQESIERLKLYVGGFDPANEDWSYSDRYES